MLKISAVSAIVLSLASASYAQEKAPVMGPTLPAALKKPVSEEIQIFKDAEEFLKRYRAWKALSDKQRKQDANRRDLAALYSSVKDWSRSIGAERPNTPDNLDSAIEERINAYVSKSVKEKDARGGIHPASISAFESFVATTHPKVEAKKDEKEEDKKARETTEAQTRSHVDSVLLDSVRNAYSDEIAELAPHAERIVEAAKRKREEVRAEIRKTEKSLEATDLSKADRGELIKVKSDLALEDVSLTAIIDGLPAGILTKTKGENDPALANAEIVNNAECSITTGDLAAKIFEINRAMSGASRELIEIQKKCGPEKPVSAEAAEKLAKLLDEQNERIQTLSESLRKPFIQGPAPATEAAKPAAK